jgi:hypothetical protein
VARHPVPPFPQDVGGEEILRAQPAPAPIDHSDRRVIRRLISVATSCGTTSISTAMAPAAS